MSHIQLKTAIPGPKGQAMLERRKNALPTGLAKSTEVVVDHAEGAIVWDVDGNQLLDFALIGHSMGGKVAMHFADKYPEFLSHLIIIDIAPKSYLFSIDIQSDTLNHKQIMQGMLALDFNGIKKREEIEILLSHQIKNDRIRQFLMKNIKRNQDMSFGWILNIEALFKNIENILAGFTPTRTILLKEFKVLFVKGSESEYITNQDMQDIKSIYKDASFEIIQNAGHWVHVEQPDILINSITEFMI